MINGDLRTWSARGRATLVICGCLVIAMVLWELAGLWGGRSEPMRSFVAAAGAGWSVQAKNIRVADEAFVVSPGDDHAIAIQSAPIDLQADLCETPRLLVDCGEGELRFVLRWRRQGDPHVYEIGRESATRSEVGGCVRELSAPELPLHPAWKGRIISLAWRIDGVQQPLTLRSVGAEYSKGSDLPAMLWRQWWAFSRIDAISINSIRAPHVLGFAPVALAALAAATVLVCHVGVAALRRKRVRGAAVAGIIAVAWLANDARWAVAQRKQLESDRTLTTSAWPAEVARMAESAREVVPDGAVYAVAGGNLPTAAGDSRLRYLLSPERIQVNVDPLQPRVALERAEYVLVMSSEGAGYEPQGSTLFVPGLSPMRVEIVRRVSGGAFIARRVRP